jgi:hypothetical protein
MESASGLLNITVCTRCGGYVLEAHGLHFSGKIEEMPLQFPDIGVMLDGIGYGAAAKEIRGLMDTFAEAGYA